MASARRPGDHSPSGIGERELLASLRTGDEAAFRQLVAELGPGMLRVAGLYSPDEQVAAEIVQETWIAVLRGLKGFEGRSSLRTWVYTVLGNCARRRARNEARSLPLSSVGTAPGEESELDWFFPPNHPRWASCWTTINTRWEALPEHALTTQQANSAIVGRLRALPPNQAAVIILRDLEGLTSDEVCLLLGVSAGNQRVLLHRARLALRRSIRAVLD